MYKNITFYPSISDWLEEDLEVRVGGKYGQKAKTLIHRVNYFSRTYIQVLFINGLVIDYDYLFSTFRNYLIFKKVHDCELYDIRDVFKKMKYSKSTFDNGFMLDYSFYRIIIHTGKRHYTDLTLDDLSEFNDSFESYIERGLQYKFWRIRSKDGDFKTRYKTSLYRLHLALFSLGILRNHPTGGVNIARLFLPN